MSRLYSKLPDSLLRDSFMDLPDHLKALTIDLWLVAATEGGEGPLPSLTTTARLIGRQPETAEAGMHDLADLGILSLRGGVWRHELYARCQAPAESTERVRRWREAKRAKARAEEPESHGTLVTRHAVTGESVETETETERRQQQRGDVSNADVTVTPLHAQAVVAGPPISTDDPMADLLVEQGVSEAVARRLSKEHRVPEIRNGIQVAREIAATKGVRNFPGTVIKAIEEHWTSVDAPDEPQDYGDPCVECGAVLGHSPACTLAEVAA